MSKSGPENAEYYCHLYFSVKSEITPSKSQFLNLSTAIYKFDYSESFINEFSVSRTRYKF